MAILLRDFFLPSKRTKFVEVPITVLLIDDENWVVEAVQRALKDQRDIRFFYCNSSKNAIEMALDVKPTVIIQDSVLPECSGFDLIKQFRAHPFTRDVPIIVFSGKEDHQNKNDAFRVGGNDYLIKLPDTYELVARIRYHSENYIRFLQRNEAYRQLEENDEILHKDLIEAAAYVSSLFPKPLHDTLDVDWVFIPSAYLGGDTFDYMYHEKDFFGFDLVDVCGHGVGAALLSVSILNYVRSIQYTHDIDYGQVMSQINKAFPMENNNSMFFSFWAGFYDLKSRKLIYISGGSPPVIVVRNEKVIELTTNGMMLGVDPDAKYVSNSVILEPNDILYLFSDGAYEIDSETGEQLGLNKFISQLVKLVPEDSLDKMVESARSWAGNKSFEDDYSLIRIRVR